MSADILDRARKLLALTASPNEHEASNAAVLACRLMREHGLQIAAGPAARPTIMAMTADEVHSELATLERERRERRAAEERLPPVERVRVRCARLHIGRRESLHLAVGEAINVGLSDVQILEFVRELQSALSFPHWTDDEILWVTRAERRARVTAQGSRVSP